MRSRGFPLFLAALSVAAIALATLTPSADELPPTQLCWLCAPLDAADVVANVILFAPFGIALAWLGWPARRTLAVAALFSGAIELSQLLFIAGRDASVSDVTMNTLGAAVGFVLFHAAMRVLRASPRTSLALTAAFGAIAALVLWTGDWILSPVLPPTTYYGQWTANLGGDLDWYRGRVLSSDIGGVVVKSRKVDDSEAIRRLLASGATVHVRGLAGPPTLRLAPFFSIYDSRREEILLLGPQGSDLVLRYRMQAAERHFDQPDFHLANAFAGVQPGDTLDLSMWRDARGACVRLNAAETCGLRPTAGRYWSLVQYREEMSERTKRFLDALAIALLVIPVGFCSARLLYLGAGAGLVVAGLGLGPMFFGVGPSPWGEWVGLGVGLAVGALIRVSFTPGRRPGVSRP